MRKAFKFYQSYYEVANELSDKDRLAFYDSLMKKQFENIEPDLKGMAKFAYISQKHSIDAQTKGYFDKTKDPTFTPIEPPCIGSSQPPCIEEKEKEKEKEKVQEQVYRKFDHLTLSIEDFEKLNQDYSKQLIDDVLDSIENYKSNKNYKSLYLTAKNWLSREKKKIDDQKKADTNFLRVYT